MFAHSSIALGGAAAGVALVCLSALVLGSPGSLLAELDRAQGRLVSIRPAATQAKSSQSIKASSFSLFGSEVPISVTLEGVSILPGRRAALISINGGGADWLKLDETRDGVSLVDVQPAKITVDTASGTKDVQFGPVTASAEPPLGGLAPAATAPFPAHGPTTLTFSAPVPSQSVPPQARPTSNAAIGQVLPQAPFASARRTSMRPLPGSPDSPLVPSPAQARPPG